MRLHAELSKAGLERDTTDKTRSPRCAYIADAFEPLFAESEREALELLDGEPADTTQNLARRTVSRTLSRTHLESICRDVPYLDALKKLRDVATFWVRKLTERIHDMSVEEKSQFVLVMMELPDLEDRLAVAVKWTGLDYSVDAFVRGVPLSML